MDAHHEALLRTMAGRIERMAENMRYAEGGVIVHRRVVGRTEDIDSGGYADAKGD